jgi:hypothetical protein
MIATALEEMTDSASCWSEHARRIARKLILADAPERLLADEFADIPFHRIVVWLDFAYAESKGWGWVDDLRVRLRQNKSKQGLLPQLPSFRKREDLDHGALNKLASRSGILDGYVEHYRLLESSGMLPANFERQIRGAVGGLPEGSLLFLGLAAPTTPAIRTPATEGLGVAGKRES